MFIPSVHVYISHCAAALVTFEVTRRTLRYRAVPKHQSVTASDAFCAGAYIVGNSLPDFVYGFAQLFFK